MNEYTSETFWSGGYNRTEDNGPLFSIGDMLADNEKGSWLFGMIIKAEFRTKPFIEDYIDEESAEEKEREMKVDEWRYLVELPGQKSQKRKLQWREGAPLPEGAPGNIWIYESNLKRFVDLGRVKVLKKKKKVAE